MGQLIEFPSGRVRFMTRIDRALKEVLSDVEPLMAERMRKELINTAGGHLDAMKFEFELRLPPGTDENEIQKIIDAINKLGARASILVHENVVLKAKLMLKDG